MSYVIVPEVSIDPSPLILELCSDSFNLETMDLDLESIERAAEQIKEACGESAHAINKAQTNLLMAYMADPKCRRWMKKDFLDRVDCDNGLLSKAARLCSFRFYTAEKLVLEDLDNNGETAPSESVARRTGVPEKTVERVKKKIQKNRDDAEEARAKALEESLQADKDDESHEVEMDRIQVTMPSDNPEKASDSESKPEVTKSSTKELEEEESEPVRELVQPVVQDTRIGLEEEAIEVEIEIDSTTDVLSPREIAFQKEIEQLKLLIEEKDQEITRLKALVEV
jgi:hypothetical protein